ncbi:MAG: HAD family hydrolase, partial [Elusimicrobia bacterium]|nr:HAD family hydrolase [Elusimicrobiota bacterium]
AAEEVAALGRLGVEVVLASGDREATVRAAAEAAGIRRWVAEARGEEKRRVVAGLQEEGRSVAMAGAGLLDATALAQADLGIGIDAAPSPRRLDLDPSGFDLAVESADLIVGQGGLPPLHDALRLALRIRGVVRENLTLAFAPQLVLLPLAAGVLAPSFGILFQPSYAAAGAAVSAAAIAVNSIRRLRL